MFAAFLEYLKTLTPEQIKTMVENTKRFSDLRYQLESRGALTYNKKTGKIIIIKDDDLVADFLDSFERLAIKGLEIEDKRNES
jgi:hypothetical protein